MPHQENIPVNSRQWVALGQACQMLEVNEATLRRWANQGMLRTFRTPGGHRRFAMGDLQALLAQSGESPERSSRGPQSIAESALQHIRRRLRTRGVAGQSWYEEIGEQDRVRLRLFGFRLLTLATDYLASRGKRQAILSEAQAIGEEYGTETARLHIPLEHVAQAFAFFRDALMEGLQESSPRTTTPRAVYQVWRQANTVTDEVFRGIIRSYDKAHARQAGAARP